MSRSLFAAGCGVIGNYRGCSFYAPGFGTFVPGEGASPYSGSPGEPAKEPELRLEALVPAHLREKAQRAVKESPPYEEPAFDIYEAEGPVRYGFGLLGKWGPPREPFAFVAEKIGRSDFLACGPVPEKVTRAAVMPGSGGSYIQRAHELGAELLITGDVSHHQAVLARDLGMGVISAGHYELEAPGVEALAQSLRGALGPGVRVFSVGGESPFYSRPRAGG